MLGNFILALTWKIHQVSKIQTNTGEFYEIQLIAFSLCHIAISLSLLFISYCSKNVLKRLYYDYYFCRQENLWRQNALKTLPVLLNSSDMLACGEDLGLIPACVHPVFSLLFLLLFTVIIVHKLLNYASLCSAFLGHARAWVDWLAHSKNAQ